MKGTELAGRRADLGYTQAEFMRELGVKSRQTISAWERPDAEVPRLVELALIALERHTECRNVSGHKATRQEAREFKERTGG